jgi:cell division protein FtsB
VLRYTQWRQLRQETAQLQQELYALQEQERALQAELQRVQTDPGRESLARQRGWIRKGEEPLRINP